ncbi:MAG TPA: NAD(P)-dependent oxidoreductase, partial [Acidimicrobiaceae bacterium]|nr:NAD(P)-dependent oxidoreductase [Acidimicrobiaceae bacterium]
DIAPIIEWLASGTAAPLVGSSLVVDGGLWMPG